MSIEEIDAEAKAIATEASTEENFNFLDRLAGRNYPTEDVEIYLDEAAGYLIQKLEVDASNTKDGEQADLIHKQIEYQREKAAKSRYVIHMEGISSEEYDACVDAATEQFPIETKDSRNPLTMAPESQVIENPDRDQYFRTLLWSKFIRKVTGPGGGVDSNITPEWVAVFANRAPITAVVKVSNTVDNLRMITDWMDRIQTDDFFPKS